MTIEVSSLIIPRVEVYWGPVNLTSPQKTPEFYSEVANLETLGPLVYDARVSLEDQGQTPSGSLKWNPSGLGFSLYEKFLTQYIQHSIVINFYYVGGKNITFEFYWGGQSDNYGKEMELGIKLVTLLDGLINANMYSTVQADAQEKGMSHRDSVSNLGKQFGVDAQNLIKYTPTALDDSTKSIVKMNYTDGSNFMDSVQNLVKNNGNMVFFNNMGGAGAVVYSPYNWEVKKGSLPQDGAKIPKGKTPDPTIRYIYAVAPGIIQSLSRTYEWQPPQKSQELSSMLGRKPQIPDSSSNPKTKAVPDSQAKTGKKKAKAPEGIHSSPNTPNIRSDNNENGPLKLMLFTEERTAKLSMTTFMCPVLTGMKPLDIILIKNYYGDYVEDWIVSSVEYQQTQGGVELSIQASRKFGVGVPMAQEPITSFFSSQKLKTLEDWEAYAWQFTSTRDKKEAVPGKPYISTDLTSPLPVVSSPAPSAPSAQLPPTPEETTTPAPQSLYSQSDQIKTFSTQDPKFFSYLQKVLRLNDVTFKTEAGTQGGTVVGVDSYLIEALASRYRSEELGPSFSVPESTRTTYNPISPTSTQVYSDGFYNFVKETYKFDPLSPRLFNDSSKTINLGSEEINRLYRSYTESGGR